MCSKRVDVFPFFSFDSNFDLWCLNLLSALALHLLTVTACGCNSLQENVVHNEVALPEWSCIVVSWVLSSMLWRFEWAIFCLFCFNWFDLDMQLVSVHLLIRLCNYRAKGADIFQRWYFSKCFHLDNRLCHCNNHGIQIGVTTSIACVITHTHIWIGGYSLGAITDVHLWRHNWYYVIRVSATNVTYPQAEDSCFDLKVIAHSYPNFFGVISNKLLAAGPFLRRNPAYFFRVDLSLNRLW